MIMIGNGPPASTGVRTPSMVAGYMIRPLKSYPGRASCPPMVKLPDDSKPSCSRIDAGIPGRFPDGPMSFAKLKSFSRPTWCGPLFSGFGGAGKAGQGLGGGQVAVAQDVASPK